ncbi:MAG: SPOR domain-containing protein [Bacteroidetes bacterium]|nr:SPOR domain-containing protein [Bacteroidota bacterium]
MKLPGDFGMTGIDKYISELLFDHDCVILPGFGGFLTNYSGARIHPIKHSFHPPARSIVFNANLRTNDGLLIDHIARARKIAYNEASALVKDYSASCLHELEAGNTIHFKHIGSCRLGKEKNLIFDPDTSSNYLADAFGLPSFVSPAIRRETVRQRLEKQLTPRPVAPEARKKRNLRPALGWAAGIAIPVAAALLMYFFNPSFVKDLNTSYSSFVPSIKFSAGEAAPSPGTFSKDAEFVDFRIIPEKAVADVAVVAETEQLPEAIPEATPVKTLKKYQIVVGAFSIESNAKKYVSALRSREYDATIIGLSSTGLFRVSISGMDARNDALSMLAQVRREENPSAWLLIVK